MKFDFYVETSPPAGGFVFGKYVILQNTFRGVRKETKMEDTNNPKPEHKLKIGHNMYTTSVGIEEAQQLKAGIKDPDLMDIEPLRIDELLNHP
jgi:hypothetical protein